MDNIDTCEMCNAIREVPVNSMAASPVTILADASNEQPVEAERTADGWVSWDVGGGMAHACSTCVAKELTIRDGAVQS